MNSIIDYLEYWAAAQPEKRLSCFLDVSGKEKAVYTYKAFADRTRALAEYLAQHAGLKYGDRALLVYPPGLDIVTAFIACARAGVIPVPVCPPTYMNCKAGLAKLAFVARDCQARIALTTAAYYRSRGQSFSTNRISPPLKGGPALPELEWVVTDDIKATAPNGFRNELNPLLFLQYTSGSTSEPKGVMVSHENVIHNALSIIDHVPIAVSWLPQYHDMGLIGYYLFPLIGGGTTYGFSAMDFLKRPILWLETISRFQATDTSSPNFGFEYCLREDKIPSYQLKNVDLSSLKVLMNAAEPVRADTYLAFMERFAPCGLQPKSHVVAYGLAENTLAATHYGRRVLTLNRRLLLKNLLHIENVRVHGNKHLRFVSCGRPLDGVHLRIVDLHSHEALGEGQIGEIWLSGKSACQGYWNRPELTRELFCNHVANDPGEGNLYIRTGDLGFLYEGELFVCSRVKDIIVIRGANYYPQDVETIVESVSRKIRPRGVAAFNGAKEGEALVVVAEVKNTKDLPDAAEIARAIRTRCDLAPYEIIFARSGTISRTSSAKNARSLTRQQFLAGKLPAIATYRFANQEAPAKAITGLQQRFRQIIEQYNLDGGEAYTFAEMGMDSLTLVELILDIKQLFLEKGAAELVADIDIQLLQRLGAAEFFSLLDDFERMPDGGIANWRQSLKRRQQEHENHVRDCMRSDAALELNDCVRASETSHQPVKNVLLTGPTGFFGPFLLSSLLQKTPHTFQVLTRAKDPAHGMNRIREALERSRLWTPALAAELEERVHVVCGDIAGRNLGLRPEEWESLAANIDAVFHNAALVNYVLNYEALRPHNVEGTRELLRFSIAGRRKEFHHISSTFIFGWTAKGTLMESDNNVEMANLDFGYSQSKWVAEQLIFAAERQGLWVRVYRPSLISASTRGIWERNDIALRLLAFMINHSIAALTRNQVSFLPADIVADDIASIFAQQPTSSGTLHITTDNYYNMVDITRLIASEYGYRFTYYDIPDFIAEMNRRCTSDDLLYPLLDFFNQSYQKISAMQLKRYNNDRYREARTRSCVRCHPSFKDTVSHIMEYMLREELIPDPPIRHHGTSVQGWGEKSLELTYAEQTKAILKPL